MSVKVCLKMYVVLCSLVACLQMGHLIGKTVVAGASVYKYTCRLAAFTFSLAVGKHICKAPVGLESRGLPPRRESRLARACSDLARIDHFGVCATQLSG